MELQAEGRGSAAAPELAGPRFSPPHEDNQMGSSVSIRKVRPKGSEGGGVGLLSGVELLFLIELEEPPSRWLQHVTNELYRLGKGRNEKGMDINGRPLTSQMFCMYLSVMCLVGKAESSPGSLKSLLSPLRLLGERGSRGYKGKMQDLCIAD